MTGNPFWSVRRDREGAAHHEAGHAVIGTQFGLIAERATITPIEGFAGHVSWLHADFFKEWQAGVNSPQEGDTPHLKNLDPHEWGAQWERYIDYWIMTQIAGAFAQHVFRGKEILFNPSNPLACSSDFEEALTYGRYRNTKDELATIIYIEWLARRTELIVKRPITQIRIEAVAAALWEKGTIEGAEIRNIVVNSKDERSISETGNVF
jgi:hypothetical protein